MAFLVGALTALVLLWAQPAAAQTSGIFALPDGAAPVALAIDGGGAVWFASRSAGAIGRLDPESGEANLLALGHGAQPASLVLAPDGNLFATDAVANLIYRIDPTTREILRLPIEGPSGPLELNGVAFDTQDRLWFTAYSGYFGWLDPGTGRSVVLPAPGGRGAVGITSAGDNVWFLSYTAEAVIRVAPDTLRTEVFALPSGHEGPRALAVGKNGEVWVTAYRSGALLRLDSTLSQWSAWELRGGEARPFAVTIDVKGNLRVSDIGQSLLLTFDPIAQTVTESIATGHGCLARSILSSYRGVWVAEARCDSIRMVSTDALATPDDR